MAKATLTQRVEVLEYNVNVLATLPERIGAVERELKEFRADVDAKFEKVGAEFAKVGAKFENVDAEFEKVSAEFGKVHGELALVRDELATMRTETRQGDEETRRYMRVLYEELVDRIKVMGEAIEQQLRRRP